MGVTATKINISTMRGVVSKAKRGRKNKGVSYRLARGEGVVIGTHTARVLCCAWDAANAAALRTTHRHPADASRGPSARCAGDKGRGVFQTHSD